MKYSRTRDAEAKARPAAVDAKPGPWRKPVKNNDFLASLGLKQARICRRSAAAGKFCRSIFLRVAHADMACYANVDLET
jgi:hypothetical protein